MTKILLDTDIGCDIDDCFALAYLLNRNDIEIMGITTVSGMPQLRAQLAHKICTGAGKDIPVHVGAEESLSGEIRQPRLSGPQPSVAESNARKYIKENTAIEFLRETIEAYPNEIILLSIGQMTNSALLFQKYPHISSLLKGMVIMGGRYTDNEYCDTAKWGITEWNILCDCKAAEIVFRQNIKSCIVIGVEQTCRVALNPTLAKNAFAALPKLQAVSDSVNPLVNEVHFHDVIAIYSWLYPQEVNWQRGNISVDLSDIQKKSATAFTPDDNGRHMLVTDFSPEAFIQNYMDTVHLHF